MPAPESRKYADAVWEYRSTRDSEFAVTHVGDLRVMVQDCDGDYSRFEVTRGHDRGGPLVAMRDDISGYPDLDGHDGYHFDVAKMLAWEVADAIVTAEQHTAWVASGEYKRLMADWQAGR